jgi:ferric-dicitrate binding protein FerR (iron transport regulator)
MKMEDEHLIDFLKGNTGEEMFPEVEKWYSASGKNRKKLEDFYYILFLNNRLQVEKQIDVEKSLSELKLKIASGERTQQKSKTKRRLSRWVQIAAAAIIAGIIFLGSVNLKNISDKIEQPFVVFTDFGERTQILLPDGSKVWLNSCSRLEYKTSLFSKKRNVKMEGEAYFEIYPDKNAPFTVNSRNLDTEVLGTKFNIHANTDDSFITTTLLEGAILVTVTNASNWEYIRMKPYQQLIYNCNTGKTTVSNCNEATDYINWINDKLYFEKTSLENITKSLERHYNIHFVFFSESIKKEIFTCDFQANENIYHVLSLLSLTGKFDYKIENRSVSLFPKKSIK